MLMNALILAGLSATGLIFAFRKLPKKVQDFMVKHWLLTEIVTFLITYTTLGGTLTALFAGAIVSGVQSVAFHIHEHQEEYEGLNLLFKWMGKKMDEGMQNLNATLVRNLKSNVVDATEELAA